MITGHEGDEETPPSLRLRPSRLGRPGDEPSSEWSALNNEQKAEHFASTGNYNSVASMLVRNPDDIYPGNEQAKRDLMIRALEQAGIISDTLSSQGVYPPQAEDSAEIGETLSTHSTALRAKALEIKLNPNGLTIEDQLKDWYPHLRDS